MHKLHSSFANASKQCHSYCTFPLLLTHLLQCFSWSVVELSFIVSGISYIINCKLRAVKRKKAKKAFHSWKSASKIRSPLIFPRQKTRKKSAKVCTPSPKPLKREARSLSTRSLSNETHQDIHKTKTKKLVIT